METVQESARLLGIDALAQKPCLQPQFRRTLVISAIKVLSSLSSPMAFQLSADASRSKAKS